MRETGRCWEFPPEWREQTAGFSGVKGINAASLSRVQRPGALLGGGGGLTPRGLPGLDRHSSGLHLQHHENAVEGDACYYHCALCSYSTKAKLNLIQHVRSMKHQRGESLRKLQRLQKGLPEEEEELSAIFSIRKCPSADTALPTPTPGVLPALGGSGPGGVTEALGEVGRGPLPVKTELALDFRAAPGGDCDSVQVRSEQVQSRVVHGCRGRDELSGESSVTDRETPQKSAFIPERSSVAEEECPVTDRFFTRPFFPFGILRAPLRRSRGAPEACGALLLWKWETAGLGLVSERLGQGNGPLPSPHGGARSIADPVTFTWGPVDGRAFPGDGGHRVPVRRVSLKQGVPTSARASPDVIDSTCAQRILALDELLPDAPVESTFPPPGVLRPGPSASPCHGCWMSCYQTGSGMFSPISSRVCRACRRGSPRV
ncbi:hypothetical protein COCON_G00101690 [Conger conger]|uniref:Uncharacterized protein n=1 Tax=Conger conger TaxID=82655 RepID=A0A9Q1DHN3_CONCO|nr:hypothetical protein COCON_G00101690 [Conger conger]